MESEINLSKVVEQIWQEYPLGRDRLHDYHNKRRGAPRISEVIKSAAEVYRIPADYILADRRAKDVVNARHVAMYVAYVLTFSSTTMIGRAFGNRDHTTVLHAVRKIGQWIEEGREGLIEQVSDVKERSVKKAAMRGMEYAPVSTPDHP